MFKKIRLAGVVGFSLMLMSCEQPGTIKGVAESPLGTESLMFAKKISLGSGFYEVYTLELRRNNGQLGTSVVEDLVSRGWKYNPTKEHLRNPSVYCSGEGGLNLVRLRSVSCHSVKIGSVALVQSRDSVYVTQQLEDYLRVHQYRSVGK